MDMDLGMFFERGRGLLESGGVGDEGLVRRELLWFLERVGGEMGVVERVLYGGTLYC